jgi:hypothetical protein
MSSPPSAKPGIPQVDNQPIFHTSMTHVVSVPRSDRWRIHHRLQELMIPCWCLPDGSLRVEVQHGIAAILLRSVVQQFIAPRTDMVNWLERCWSADQPR